MPVVVLLALALTSGRPAHRSTSTGGGSATGVLAPLTLAPPPSPGPAQAAACTRVVAQLPVSLQGLKPRRVFTDSSYVVAWGEPPIALRCGVDRPADLVPGSSTNVTDVGEGTRTVEWFNRDQTFTSIDRSVYIELSVPAQRSPSDYLPAISAALATALPAVCTAAAVSGSTPVPKSRLCTYRR